MIKPSAPEVIISSLPAATSSPRPALSRSLGVTLLHHYEGCQAHACVRVCMCVSACARCRRAGGRRPPPDLARPQGRSSHSIDK
ncbi:hypothetical protein EVAR_43042_1 [Eumeta japonica]|uniref:Uncharacterized protein n=1 Tax=Eumeta variegata TaxID=151549 RepID=A0A4C1XJD3_EUMVA|nr:hypothetical protein EVAR_43042_1 [Eumeta japonica]